LHGLPAHINTNDIDIKGGGSEYIGWHGEVELQVAVDGSDRVQQSASGKYGMKVGNVLESRGSIEGQ
jgi:hypothetical protein